jgi:hypothetical protein
MTEPNVNSLTKEQLTTKIKSLDKLIGIMAGMVIVAFVAGIVAYFLGLSIIGLILPIVFLPLLIIPLSGKKKCSAELVSRK